MQAFKEGKPSPANDENGKTGGKVGKADGQTVKGDENDDDDDDGEDGGEDEEEEEEAEEEEDNEEGDNGNAEEGDWGDEEWQKWNEENWNEGKAAKVRKSKLEDAPKRKRKAGLDVEDASKPSKKLRVKAGKKVPETQEEEKQKDASEPSKPCKKLRVKAGKKVPDTQEEMNGGAEIKRHDDEEDGKAEDVAEEAKKKDESDVDLDRMFLQAHGFESSDDEFGIMTVKQDVAARTKVGNEGQQEGSGSGGGEQVGNKGQQEGNGSGGGCTNAGGSSNVADKPQPSPKPAVKGDTGDATPKYKRMLYNKAEIAAIRETKGKQIMSVSGPISYFACLSF